MALTASLARPRRSDGVRITTSPVARNAHHPRLLANAKADPYHTTPPVAAAAPPTPPPRSSGGSTTTAAVAATTTPTANVNNTNTSNTKNVANTSKRRHVDIAKPEIDPVVARKSKFATDKPATPIPPPPIPPPYNINTSNSTTPPPTAVANKKRALDADDAIETVVAKRARLADIAVEIPAKPPTFHAQFQAATPVTETTTVTVSSALRQSQRAQSPKPVPAEPAVAANGSTSTTSTRRQRSVSAQSQEQQQQTRRTRNQQQQQPQQQQEQTQQEPQSSSEAAQTTATTTRHQKKVAKGLKNELDKLYQNSANLGDYANADGAAPATRSGSTQENANAAAAVAEQTGGRKLRSQEATWYKSELSQYFPDYDEVIGNIPKETHLVNFDTAIVIVPDLSPQSTSDEKLATVPTPPTSWPIKSYADSLYTDLCDAQRIDFSFLTNNSSASVGAGGIKQTRSTGSVEPSDDNDPDPLPDAMYIASHKKLERNERSTRNAERARSLHERDQIARLLDGLQGPDWLRTLGVGGATEAKRRQFEPARQHFIKNCRNVLDKFRMWQVEERRRRKEEMDKKAAAAAAAENGAETAVEDESDERATVANSKKKGRGTAAKTTAAARRKGTAARRGKKNVGDHSDADNEGEGTDGADDSDEDASVAKQLREEALAAEIARKRRLAALKGWETKRAMKAAADKEKEKAASAKSGRGASATKKKEATAMTAGKTQPKSKAAVKGKTTKSAAPKTTTTTRRTRTRVQLQEEEDNGEDSAHDADHEEDDFSSDDEDDQRHQRGRTQQQHPKKSQTPAAANKPKSFELNQDHDQPEPAEITSFFARRYQRDAALSRNRRRGRIVLAWGHPVPDPPEREFALPPEWWRRRFGLEVPDVPEVVPPAQDVGEEGNDGHDDGGKDKEEEEESGVVSRVRGRGATTCRAAAAAARPARGAGGGEEKTMKRATRNRGRRY
ncbi:hypothetical protein VTJ04DRAFT_3653 [Mycothermus thermophilus]|uniref:uncharacterized protein n=1 Tax=Humicola insolens TaxID=85995 RepID=UPI003742692D